MRMTDVFYEMTGNRRRHTIISLCALSQSVLGSESVPTRDNTHYYHQEVLYYITSVARQRNNLTTISPAESVLWFISKGGGVRVKSYFSRVVRRKRVFMLVDYQMIWY